MTMPPSLLSTAPRNHQPARSRLVPRWAQGLVLATMLAVPACGGDEEGTLRLTMWGEEFIEEGIPEGEFVDGFSARFDHFLVVAGNFRAENGDTSFGSTDTWLVDLVAPGPHELTTAAVKAGHWSNAGYSITPITAATILHASATDEQRALMEAGGYSVHVEGSASRAGESWQFSWGFDEDTTYTDCVQLVDGRQEPGFSVAAGAETPLELTIHGDHFFYDDLASDDAVLRFHALASADEDGDGAITLSELAEVPLIDLPAGTYGTGNFSDVDDLRSFVRALVTTLGHFNGEGHCLPR